MRLLALALLVFFIGARTAETSVLTFDEAVELAAARSSRADEALLESEIDALGRARLPSVRLQLMTNTSQTLHFISDEPFQLFSAVSVLAFDYPLWDGGMNRSRIERAERRLRRSFGTAGLDDAAFVRLLEAFGDLYLAQRQSQLLAALGDARESERIAERLASGEITNLQAAERREVTLSLTSRRLEMEARRIDFAARLRLLTGLAEEPVLVLDLEQAVPELPPAERIFRDDQVEAASVAAETSRARLDEVLASHSWQASLSGMAGVGATDSDLRRVDSGGTFGLYALRLNLSYPLFRGVGDAAIAEARAELRQMLAARDAAIEASRARAAGHRLRAETAAARISLLRESIEISIERERSLERLVSAGLRSESELVHAAADTLRRRMDLLAAQVERWKGARMLVRMADGGGADHP